MLNNDQYTGQFGSYDPTIIGKAVISLKTPTHFYLGYPGLGKGLQYDKSDIRIGYCTGWYKKDGLDFLVQIEFENMQGSDEYGYYQYGYVVAGDYRLHEIGSNSGAQSMINELIQLNRKIVENNLICARLVSIYDEKNIPVSKNKRLLLYQLQQNYEYRTNRLLNSALLKDQIKSVQKSTFNHYSNDLQSFMDNPKIGVAPVVIYVISAVVITALISGMIYLIFRGDHAEAKKEITYSDELTADLMKHLPQDVYERLKTENAGNAQEFNQKIDYLARKNKQSSFAGSLKTISYAGAGILGFMLLSNLFASNAQTKYYNRATKAIR